MSNTRKSLASYVGQAVYDGKRPVSARWLKRYLKDRRDAVARQFREARKTPEGRLLARAWFLAKRKTERELAATAFGLFPATGGGLSAIVRGEVK